MVLALAWLLDVFVGEPPAWAHPVVWMGRAIGPLTRMRAQSPRKELFIGAVYALTLASLCAWFGAWGTRVLSLWPAVRVGVEAYLLWSCFALRALLAAGADMSTALAQRDLARSRNALISLCSRDPSDLTQEELAGATIESLSENTSDSVVAPLFYFALGGVPLALFYRAVNTLDAMVGYRGRFEYRGKVAARLDDLLNFVPARVTALLLLVSGALRGLAVKRGFHVWLRDARKTESPNAGHPMAVAAGLVGVRLDKRDAYVLGTELALPNDTALARTMDLVRTAGWLALAFCVMLLAVRGALFAHVAR